VNTQWKPGTASQGTTCTDPITVTVLPVLRYHW